MSKWNKYLVYRKYSQEERYDPAERLVFYGWSDSKDVVMAFLKQRTLSKYKVRKFHPDGDIRDYVGDDSYIDRVNLKSAKSGESIILFITKRELDESEKKIDRMFRNLSSVQSAGDRIIEVLTLFVNLTEYYMSALDFLGFNPPELESLFPSATLDFVTTDVSKKIIYSLESFIRVLRDDM